MHDWAGTRERLDALAVPCRDCNAAAGEPCVVRDGKGRIEKPLEAFPAHTHRMNDARKAPESRPAATDAGETPAAGVNQSTRDESDEMKGGQ